ncbi:putative RNA-dependent RNA polymerase 5 [Sesbania bispinosa]|nr:putative RNA-dependent RNA polymerase 5 [Sesbania bispinosa]
MAEQLVCLPALVENRLRRIYEDQNQAPPNSTVRQRLTAIEEHRALELLNTISKNKIKSLSAFINHVLNHPQYSSPSKSSLVRFSQPSDALSALGELEIRKAFPLLSYIGQKSLEDVFSFDGGKEEKKKDPTASSVKCYFVRMESYSSVDARVYILSNKTMFEARALFMHAHMLPSIDKYMARFSLILSKTLSLDIDLATMSVNKKIT